MSVSAAASSSTSSITPQAPVQRAAWQDYFKEHFSDVEDHPALPALYDLEKAGLEIQKLLECIWREGNCDLEEFSAGEFEKDPKVYLWLGLASSGKGSDYTIQLGLEKLIDWDRWNRETDFSRVLVLKGYGGSSGLFTDLVGGIEDGSQQVEGHNLLYWMLHNGNLECAEQLICLNYPVEDDCFVTLCEKMSPSTDPELFFKVAHALLEKNQNLSMPVYCNTENGEIKAFLRALRAKEEKRKTPLSELSDNVEYFEAFKVLFDCTNFTRCSAEELYNAFSNWCGCGSRSAQWLLEEDKLPFQDLLSHDRQQGKKLRNIDGLGPEIDALLQQRGFQSTVKNNAARAKAQAKTHLWIAAGLFAVLCLSVALWRWRANMQKSNPEMGKLFKEAIS